MHYYLSFALIIIQTISLIFILVSGPIFAREPALLFAQIVAVGFAFWGAYVLHKKSKFSAMPEVKKGATLITDGPFEYVRHPIYSGLILFSLVAILSFFNLYRVVVFLVLIMVFLFKLHLEEEYLTHHFPLYEQYQKKTKKLIPFLY